MIRLFISHRDNYKREARELADELEGYGISSFVAHESIEAGKQWQNEIMLGLKTMDVMLAFITDDFAGSVFCDQEVGFALGRGIPVVSIKLEGADPPGFISNLQALGGDISETASYAAKVFNLVVDAVGQRDKVTEGLLEAFVAAPSWSDAEYRFERMNSFVTHLSEQQERRLVGGYNRNDQLQNCWHISRSPYRIIGFLKKVSGKSYALHERRLVEVG